MNKRTNGAMSTKNLVMYALLTAIVVVLQLIAEFGPKVGPCSLSFALVPIVVGSALCGWKCGGWLGFVFSVVVLLCPSTQTFYAISIPGTIVTVLVKGVAAGIAAALVYKLIADKNRTVAVICAAITTPVVNTGIFLIGCRLFFFEAVKGWAGSGNVVAYMLLGLAGFNFLFELVTNILLSPAAVRIIKIREK